MTINTTNTVRDLAVTLPGATRVFERLGIDYCCGGGRTLVDACQAAGVAVEEAVNSLESAVQKEPQPVADWPNKSLTDLAVYIIDKHHFYTKQEIERLDSLLDKVRSRHGENHPELVQLEEAFSRLKDELIPHMLKEEQVLFPYLARMEEAVVNQQMVSPPFFGTVRNPIRMMIGEHDTAGALLHEIRKLTVDYRLPGDACMSYRALYQGLQEFEADLHQHIHLENNILFPRAAEMEDSVVHEFKLKVQEGGEHRCFGHS